MDQKTVSDVAHALGVHRAADEFLDRNTSTWTRALEDFFLDHWSKLHPETVVRWLSRPRVEDIERPLHGVVQYLVQRLLVQRDHEHLFDFGLWNLLSIPDATARDGAVELLRGSLDAQQWEALLEHAEGCALFRTLACNGRSVPFDRYTLTVGNLRASTLAAELFDVRRDEIECARRLEKRCMDPDVGDEVLRLLDQLGVLAQVATPLTLTAALPSLCESEAKDYGRVRLRLGLLSGLIDHPTARDVVVTRTLAASARGVPWGDLWWEIPEAFRDDVAIDSLKTARPAPWALNAIRRRFVGDRRAHEYSALREHPWPDDSERERFYRAGLRWGVVSPQTVMDDMAKFWPTPMGQPVPEEPPRRDEAIGSTRTSARPLPAEAEATARPSVGGRGITMGGGAEAAPLEVDSYREPDAKARGSKGKKIVGIEAFLATVLMEDSEACEGAGHAARLPTTLEASGLMQRELVDRAITRVERLGAGAVDAHTLGRLFDSGKLWEKSGVRFAELALQPRPLNDSFWFTQVITASIGRPSVGPNVVEVQSDGGRSDADRIAGEIAAHGNLARSVHTVFASKILDLLEPALQEHDEARARTLLQALSRLSPTRRLQHRIRKLRSEDHSEAVSSLLDANIGLLSRDDDEAPDAIRVGQAVFICAGHWIGDDIDEGDGDP